MTAESDVVIAGNLSVAGDIDISGSNLNPVVASGDDNNVLSSLQVDGTTYTLPTGSGGGGTAVAANPAGITPSSQNDDLDVVRIGGTDYNVRVQVLDDLTDVSASTPPVDGQALIYHSSSQKWQPGDVATSSGATTLNGLTDVSVSTPPADGQALVYDTSTNQWVQGTGLTGWTDSSGHLIPKSNAQYDIGSAEKKVRHLYLSQNSLYMGSGNDEIAGTAISLDASGDLAVGGTKLVKGDAEGKVPVDKMPVVGVPARTFEVDVAKHYDADGTNNYLSSGSYFSIDGIVKRKLVMIRGFSLRL